VNQQLYIKTEMIGTPSNTQFFLKKAGVGLKKMIRKNKRPQATFFLIN